MLGVPEAHRMRVHFQHVYFQHFLTHRSPPKVYPALYRKLQEKFSPAPHEYLCVGQTLLISTNHTPGKGITMDRTLTGMNELAPAFTFIEDMFFRSPGYYEERSRVVDGMPVNKFFPDLPLLIAAYDLETETLYDHAAIPH